MQTEEKKDRLTVFDTTLRDGEQGAGCSMSHVDKVAIAMTLEEIGVDVIEAGFPASNTEAFATVRTVAERSSVARICALARCVESDVSSALRAIQAAQDRGVPHIFVATEKDHMRVKLDRTEVEVIELVRENVTRAAGHAAQTEFSLEVGATSEFGFTCEVIECAIAAGATTINVPDTKGFCFPWEYKDFLLRIQNKVPALANVVLSVHCHNDRGLATINTLEGVRAGARQIECTVNGIGERTGNTSLEQVLMAIELRPEEFNVCHGVDVSKLTDLSRQVSKACGIPVPRNLPYVGSFAFAHESGIHQDGTLKDTSLYEICDPRVVGNVRQLPLGKLSGRNGVRARMHALGFCPTDSQVDEVYRRFVSSTTSAVGGCGEAFLEECIAAAGLQ